MNTLAWKTSLKRRSNLAAALIKLSFLRLQAALHHRRSTLKRRTPELERQGKISSFNRVLTYLS